MFGCQNNAGFRSGVNVEKQANKEHLEGANLRQGPKDFSLSSGPEECRGPDQDGTRERGSSTVLRDTRFAWV